MLCNTLSGGTLTRERRYADDQQRQNSLSDSNAKQLDERCAVAFEGMEMETKHGYTALTGEIIDQPHLYGILDRINGLGLELLSVQALPEDTHQGAGGKREPKEPKS